MDLLPVEFYQRPTADVARDLVGAYLCHTTAAGLTVGRIVETEAYLGSADAASHASRRRTARNWVMFDKPGHSYVYFIYGNYFCFNAVAHDVPPGAVLLRALEPVLGIHQMAVRRQRNFDDVSLTNGPGKLADAMYITHEHNALPLFMPQSPLVIAWALRGVPLGAAPRLGQSTRIGIRQAVDLPLRFFDRNSRYVSGR